MGTTAVTNRAAPAVSLEEAKAFLRVGNSEEDALLAGLVRSASDLCEAFTGLKLVAQEMTEVISSSNSWVRLSSTPVRAIEEVLTIGPDGAELPLPASDYAVDIDANGDGWVRVTSAGGAAKVKVRFSAGLAGDWNGIPEVLRQGIVRLVAHLYTNRDDEAGKAPPFAVTALWRPWRRMRLG